MSDLNHIVSRLAKTTWVVLYKTRPSPRHPTGQLTLLTEPGENKVWSISNRAIAEMHAKENHGMATTWGDAWGLLVKEYGSLQHLEDDLMQRAQAVQEASVKQQSRATDRPGMRVNPTDFNDNVNPNN